MTTEQAGLRLGISADMVKKHCQRGTIKAEKHGRGWWITEVALKQFIETRRKPGQPRKERKQ
jgi:excisionase family DNA binding protein